MKNLRRRFRIVEIKRRIPGIGYGSISDIFSGIEEVVDFSEEELNRWLDSLE
jgi:hypothetical protein